MSFSYFSGKLPGGNVFLWFRLSHWDQREAACRIHFFIPKSAWTVDQYHTDLFGFRNILPAEIAYLSPPRKYYDTFKSELESLRPGNQQLVDDSLKGSYIFELENAIDINSNVFRRKSSFLYNALLFALLAVIPYLTCLGFHLSKKDVKGTKVEFSGRKIVILSLKL